MPRLGELWAEYLADVVPVAAGTAQREECQRAFYAGAQAMYLAMTEALFVEDDAFCEARVTALQDELAAYRRDFKVRAGIQ